MQDIYRLTKDRYRVLVNIQDGGKPRKKKKPMHLRISTVAPLLGDNMLEIGSLKFEPAVIRFIKNLFPVKPNVNLDHLIVNQVGLYSMTKHNEANQLLDILRNDHQIDFGQSILLDATSGIGGFILNMYDHFKHVIGYEIDRTQYNILKHNCEVYGTKNVELHNLDYTKNINRQSADIVLIDPPWGGLKYNDSNQLNLKLGTLTMSELIELIDCRILIIKIPSNHMMTIFEESGYPYKVHMIGNYICVLIDKQNKKNV